MKNINIYLIVIMIVIIITNIFTNVVEGNTSVADAIIGPRKNATSVPNKDDIGKDMGTLPVTASPRLNNIIGGS